MNEIKTNFANEGQIMFFWIFMLLMDLFIPFTMIYFGKRFLHQATCNINVAFGYRTAMSMKNKDTWQFANKLCGRLWFKCGVALLPVSVIPLIFVLEKSVDMIGFVGGIVCVIQLVPLVGAIIPVEIALKRTFDRNGLRR